MLVVDSPSVSSLLSELPTGDREVALAIQDRMFKDNGEFFYPAFPNDTAYEEYITGTGAMPPPGPSALAEFFGDHMVVNGKAWPKLNVKPRKYRLRLLNGCDSRFLAIQFLEAATNTDKVDAGGTPIPFTVIGSDQSLGTPKTMNTLLFETGSRYDIIFDFAGLQGKRIIMKNIGGDSPFGGDIPGGFIYDYTDRIMAFDVQNVPSTDDPVPLLNTVNNYPDPDLNNAALVDVYRRVALFEGLDEYGRLQPLLGTIGPSYKAGTMETINWPSTPEYINAPGGGLTGPMEGTIAWHSPTTENPLLGDIEEWEIWNLSADAHPYVSVLCACVASTFHAIDSHMHSSLLSESTYIWCT